MVDKGCVIRAVFLVLFLLTMPLVGQAWVKGIYVTQHTLENTKTTKYLIRRAKAVGINTFVIDFYRNSKRTRQNIALVKAAKLHYVARIVMFPYGALEHQLKSKKFMEVRYRRIRQAIALGADEIQLDYIRFKPTQRPSRQNAHKIYAVIQHVKKMLQGTGVKLQIDIFGVAAHGDSIYIGQSVKLFANSVDAICPMVYPSHYEPFRYHAKRPYKTIYDSLMALRRQLKNNPNVRVYAYIELYNYRYPLSRKAKIHYILEEMRAVRNAHANGWYAWSARNKYNLLFEILASRRRR